PIPAPAGGAQGARGALVPLQRRQRFGRYRPEALATGGGFGLSADLRRRAQDRGQRPGGDRQLPGLRLGGQVHRGFGRRGGAGRGGDGRYLHPGLRLRGHGPPCRLARCRRRPGGGRPGPGAAADPVPGTAFRRRGFPGPGAAGGRPGWLVPGGGQRGYPQRRWPFRRRCRRRQGRLRPYPAGRGRALAGGAGQGPAWPESALGPARLPAALGPAPGLENRPGAGPGRRPARGRIRPGRHERRDAGDRPAVAGALPLARAAGAAVPDRQPREEDAGRLHPSRWLRHHRRRPPLPGTAGARRVAAALRPRRPAALRAPEEPVGAAAAARLGGLSRGRRRARRPGWQARDALPAPIRRRVAPPRPLCHTRRVRPACRRFSCSFIAAALGRVRMFEQYGLHIALACAAVAIVYGLVVARWIVGRDAGSAEMQRIAGAVQEGASAYLRRQYMTIAMVGVVLFLVIGFVPVLGWPTAIGFAIGAVLSGLAGF